MSIAGETNHTLCERLLKYEKCNSKIIQAFRNTDRGDFVREQDRHKVYSLHAFKNGCIHLSSPSLYAKILQNFELENGLSFLNIGSGTGYFSCLVSYLIGSSGICHGIDINDDVVAHSRICVAKWLQTRSETLCSSYTEYSQIASMIQESVSFVHGNCFHLNAQSTTNYAKYDRIYVGAACPETHKIFFYNLLQINGILILPINDKLVKIKRISNCTFTTTFIGNGNVFYSPLSYVDEFRRGQLTAQHNSNIRNEIRDLLNENKLSPSMAITQQVERIAFNKSVLDLIEKESSSSNKNSITTFFNPVPSASKGPMKPRLLLQHPMWIPNKFRHAQFPKSFRSVVKTILMCSSYEVQGQSQLTTTSRSKRRANINSIPTQIWFLILSFCARDWFQPSSSLLQAMYEELLVERHLRIEAERKLREATGTLKNDSDNYDDFFDIEE